ncbi:MAG: hypothetical protein NTW97_12500 [Candidatus Krumholzibacteria bacterium]|nr:hypothetical protein [Candidatus Krumholzibacteria bacterium]
MLVRCSLCGGENAIDPGQEMLACSYCGSALAIDKAPGPEHLILVHTRDDRAAEGVLRSFLIEKNLRRPVGAAIDFSFIPYAMIETGDGETSIAPACASHVPQGGVPYPPAGEYRFFDETGAPSERIVPIDRIDTDAIRIVHLPVYGIRYKAGEWKGTAAIVGESWQVIADELPPERPRVPNLGILIAAALLFAAYLVIGRFASNVLGRLALIMAASAAGYALFTIYERAAKHQ